jgi:membrane protein implicated in regulation of membrane protease activity
MINPLRSEAEAFRFLLGTVVYFAAIAVAGAFGGVWWGLGVFVLASAVVVWLWVRARRPREPVETVAPVDHDVYRVLVVANETVGGSELRERIRAAVEGREGAEVLVVSPALNSPLRHWVSDEDGARSAAQQRLEESTARLERDGLAVRGTIGDGEPLQAIEDALRTFGADEIVISTHPPGRSHWLEQGLVEQARERFELPVAHVVVDLAGDRSESR